MTFGKKKKKTVRQDGFASDEKFHGTAIPIEELPRDYSEDTFIQEPTPGGGYDVRTFDSGATRDTDKDKPEYCGFTAWEVLVRFGEYMHKHRFQKDGSIRASDNWKKGIPRKVYMESLYRHWVDVMALSEMVETIGEDDPNYAAFFGEENPREHLTEALCAMFFNVQGLLYELLNGR